MVEALVKSRVGVSDTTEIAIVVVVGSENGGDLPGKTENIWSRR